MKTLQIYFRDERQFRLFIVMCLSTLFGITLLSARLYSTSFDLSQVINARDFEKVRGTPTFLFLIWNLFLAWVPYWIALSIEKISRWSGSWLVIALILIVWLLFFPNAPYIVTDLLHLKSRSPIPKWYDLMVLVSFAWTGLMLGFLSLYEIQLFLRKRLHTKLVWLFTISAIILCAFGIFLGRFLRWNSWDVISNPGNLFQDIIINISNPGAFSTTFNIILVFSGFLLLAYVTLVTLIGEEDRKRK